MSGWNHEGVFKEKPCKVCGTNFKPKSGVHSFCSNQCKGQWKYVSGQVTTESQYKRISGNWERYFSRLVGRSFRRTQINRDDLLTLLERQNKRCALTGIELTCHLQKGKRAWTNASIDRIKAGGDYGVENIQLVCHAVNLFRCNMPLDEFKKWCRLVVEHEEQNAA